MIWGFSSVCGKQIDCHSYGIYFYVQKEFGWSLFLIFTKRWSSLQISRVSNHKQQGNSNDLWEDKASATSIRFDIMIWENLKQ